MWNDGFSDACIGSAIVPLRPTGLKFGQLVDIPSLFMDKRGKVVGKVMVTAVLNESQIVLAEAEVDVPKDFTGHISISEIRVTGLKNKEIMGKQVVLPQYLILLAVTHLLISS